MKILMVSYAALPEIKTGVSNVIFNIAEELKVNNHDVYVFSITHDTTRGNDGEFYDGTTEAYSYRSYITYKYNNEFNELSYNNKKIEQTFMDYLKKVEPDLVHFHAMQQIGTNLIKIAKKMNKKTILTMHDWWWICPRFFMTNKTERCGQIIINQLRCEECLLIDNNKTSYNDFLINRNNYLKEILVNYVDEILCVSKYLKKFIEENFSEIKQKIHLNVNGVKKNSIKIRNGLIHNEKVIFGFVGGLHKEKGYDIVIKAFSDIDIKKYDLLIFGITSLSFKQHILKFKNIFRETSNLKECFNVLILKFKKFLVMNNKRNNNSFIYFPPYKLNEIESVFSKFDILLIASTVLESFSLVAREALLSGCLVITSKCGGPEEIIEDGVNGFVVESRNMEELRKKILYLIDNRDMIKKMQSNIPNSIKNINTINEQVIELIEIYERNIKN